MKLENFDGAVIPLSDLLLNGYDAEAMANSDEKIGDEGPRGAFFASQRALRCLWGFDNPRWRALRRQVRAGSVKDTKGYGNTSVSMGASRQLFAEHQGSKVVIFNCGTGPAKFQVYEVVNGVHRLVTEVKQPNGGFSINDLESSGFTPKEKGKTREELRNTFAVWVMELLAAHHIEFDTPLYALVTGTIREYFFEKATADQRSTLNADVNHVFALNEVKPVCGNTYFITQDQEGEFEVTGASVMYANLTNAGLIPAKTQVVLSFGIGRGSTQWSVLRPDGSVLTFGYPFGMNKLSQLADFPAALLTEYLKPDSLHLEAFLSSAEAIVAAGGFPTIALKSGTMLLVENEKRIRELLTPAHPYAEVAEVKKESDAPPVVVHVGSQDAVLEQLASQKRQLERIESLISQQPTQTWQSSQFAEVKGAIRYASGSGR
jgi:hypothetical protein